jgi:hypothetical protein
MIFDSEKCRICKRRLSTEEEYIDGNWICYSCNLLFTNYEKGKCLFCHGTDLLLFSLVQPYWKDIDIPESPFGKVDSPYHDTTVDFINKYEYCAECAIFKLNMNEDTVKITLSKYNQATAERILDKLNKEQT